MRVSVVWWQLDGSAQTIDSLATYLREEAVARFATMPGLVLKAWISDRERNRWGAVLLWESAEAAARPLSARAAELIGFGPAEQAHFDVEAITQGAHALPALGRLGAAFTRPGTDPAPGAGGAAPGPSTDRRE
jgi:hypothetical protein